MSSGEAENLNIPRDDWTKRVRHELVRTNHPIFSRGELCPVPALFGIPLLVYKHRLGAGIITSPPNLKNQPAVYLRIEADTGLAPMHWVLDDPGPVIVVRQDRKPLTLQVMETILEFHKSLINGFGYPESDGWAPTHQYITKASFQFFSRSYYQQQDEKGRPGFDAFYEPL